MAGAAKHQAHVVLKESGPSEASTPMQSAVKLPPLRTSQALKLAQQQADAATTTSTPAVTGTRRSIAPTSVRTMGTTDVSTASSTRTQAQRGYRYPVKLFRGAQFEEPNSVRPPAQSALPDMSNWRTPPPIQRTVAMKMAKDSLEHFERYESPFKCETLRQPEPLRCTPIPQSNDTFRGDILDKPTVLAAAVKSLPSNVSPLLQRKTVKLSVADMVTVLNHVSKLGQNHSGKSPAQLHEAHRQANDPMFGADLVQDQIESFEEDVSEKVAFGRFVTNNKKKRLPVMVIRQFRHQLLEESNLVAAIRALPLNVIEKEIESMGPRTLNAAQWMTLLTKLVGDTFTRLEAQTLFSFFDTDVDGDIDQREVCNGFVYVRSADGPMVAVLHRCKAFLQPNIKDTRLTFMTRFELVLMADAIAHAAEATFSPEEHKELKQALTTLLTGFGTNRRGEFPFDDVRTCVLKSAPICRAINSFTVPREPELFSSPLSAYMRSGEPDEGEQPFRLMMSLKQLDKNLRAAAALNSQQLPGANRLPVLRTPAFASKDDQRRDLDDVEVHSDDSDYDAMRANLDLLHDADPNYKPPEAKVDMSTSLKSLKTKSFMRLGARRSTVGLSDDGTNLLTPTAGAATEGPGSRPLSSQSHVSATSDNPGGLSEAELALAQRPVYEPDEPEYFTLRGTLYRKLAGGQPEVYWVTGMPTSPKYSESRR